ncbi:CLUMA_CG018673, isoform A [Clunio marinus]|uniref:CLUMA_CG018673, isoform A n=1 Tax=Clunio marinus TaxID=568069 RepID=A0A1J1J2Y4_9DIPT|nr:CLUMA_CG018673, isoform A [Clunio marinus]
MGNAYQSLIIASMFFSRDGLKFKSFDEMLNTISRMETVVKGFDFKVSAEKNIALIGRCDFIEYLYEGVVFDFPKYFYILPDRIMKFYEKFPVNNKNPFNEMIQRHFDYAYESGMRQYLGDYVKQFEPKKIDHDDGLFENDVDMLTLDDNVMESFIFC